MDNEDKKVLVCLENVSSQEYYYLGQNKIKAVFSEVSGEIYAGDVFGISSDKKLASKLLAEIIASVRPYYGGKCTLLDFGIMQKKRVLLPHVFFIDTPNMPYENMTVLEYLMFITAISPDSAVARQKYLLNLLLEFGLDYVALSNVPILTDGEKIIISVICAYLSDSKIISLNLCEYNLSVKEMEILGRVFTKITENGTRCVVLATMQASFIGMSCNRVMYLSNGKMRYCGSKDDMVAKYDRVKLMITDRDCSKIMIKIADLFPEYEFTVDLENYRIFVATRSVDDKFLLDNFVGELAKFSILPDSIKVNKGRVRNSFEEIDRVVDL